jgi:hypothetical protein
MGAAMGRRGTGYLRRVREVDQVGFFTSLPDHLPAIAGGKDRIMMNHTPGPWRIGDAGGTVFGPPNGNPSPEIIAIVNAKDSPIVSGRRKANARLIAAAPDLLAAIQNVMTIIEARGFKRRPEDPQGSLWMVESGIDKYLDLARAAIAKAECRA